MTEASWTICSVSTSFATSPLKKEDVAYSKSFAVVISTFQTKNSLLMSLTMWKMFWFLQAIDLRNMNFNVIFDTNWKTEALLNCPVHVYFIYSPKSQSLFSPEGFTSWTVVASSALRPLTLSGMFTKFLMDWMETFRVKGFKPQYLTSCS